MSGVWVFKQNGVVRLVESPGSDSGSGRRKILVHVPTNEVVTSYGALERILSSLGWERYYDDPDLLQFHKRSTVHLISLPKDFNKFKSMHMFDIVIKNRNKFEKRADQSQLKNPFLFVGIYNDLKRDFGLLYIQTFPSPTHSHVGMSGVWVFKQNGVVRLVESPGSDSGSGRRKILVHVPTNEVVTSYDALERILSSLGWERYYDDPDLLQFHKRSTVHLISLPKDFNKFKSMHMFDIVVKNRNKFEVRDM
ncbi:hypothetical protein L1987_17224 [Smallanthus sonchifolius]|uniref:Uncharacterized protein n=1 Tax=Smallanthus sonchifolius TaxID=185202 RepID=A0ACB9IW77_9ASTR|nr:hypothetical protein L1987_17224 [Smallanthus sonchifolius]